MQGSDVNDIVSTYGGVVSLDMDDALRRHIEERATYGKHRVSFLEIAQVHQSRHKLFVNSSPTGRAPLVMVGATRAGRFLCIPIEPTSKRGVWRPITAYEANRHHIERYKENQG